MGTGRRWQRPWAPSAASRQAARPASAGSRPCASRPQTMQPADRGPPLALPPPASTGWGSALRGIARAVPLAPVGRLPSPKWASLQAPLPQTVLAIRQLRQEVGQGQVNLPLHLEKFTQRTHLLHAASEHATSFARACLTFGAPNQSA